jgi:PAS domain S-box-containing protein
MMKIEYHNLADQYAIALREYLDDRNEGALHRAYELGREAITSGFGGIELSRIHSQALIPFLGSSNTAENTAHLVAAASNFLIESLSPLEMIHRGFPEAVDTLMVSEERYRNLVETAQDLIYTVSQEGIITSLNPAFEKLTNFSRSEWVGRPISDLIHPEDRYSGDEILQRVYHREIPPAFKLRILSKSHDYLIGEFTLTPQLHNDEVIGALGIARDVTARVHAEEIIRNTAQQLQTAQQIAHIGSWEWDIQKNSSVWSKEMYHILGMKPQETGISYESYLDMSHPLDRMTVENVIAEAVRTKTPFHFEHRIIQPGGAIRVLESRGEVICDGYGNPVRMTGTAQDITSWKQADEALKMLAGRVINAQEEERQRIARELHDNVCQQLSGMRFSLEEVQENIPAKNQKALRRIRMTRKRIDGLISEIRRMSTDLRPASLDDFGLAVALRRLCEDHQKIHATKTKFSKNAAIHEHYSTHIEIALYRIVQEALSNIAKHAGATKINVTLTGSEHALIVQVEDNGRGFTKKRGTGSRPPGHGFGLVSMKERSELVGGSFRIETYPRKGTTIHVKIPL